MTTIQTLVFADQSASAWGVYWLPVEGDSAPLAYHVEGTTGVLRPSLERHGHDDPWRLEGDGVSLVFTPSGPAGRAGPEQAGIDSIEQLCIVSGSVAWGASEHEIDCLGWRGRLDGGFDLAALDTVREVYGWVDPADGVAMQALRPRKSRGHDSDLVSAAVLEPEPAPRVAEPRLSSTYDAAGVPSRVGLELWFESEGSDDELEDGNHQFPRRAAGEAIGDPLRWEVGHFQIQAVPLRWHSRGSDGTGVYLLGQRG